MSDASLPHCAGCGRVEYDCACPGHEPDEDQLLREALREVAMAAAARLAAAPAHR